ncbi:hypothetical protein JCM10212_004858 [Sporobolomyces blumeae]
MSKLSPDARRIRTIIIATPFLVASSILMYKRLFLGEEQRRLPRPAPLGSPEASATIAGTLREVASEPPIKSDRGEWNGVPDDVRRRIQAAEQGQDRRI